MGCSALDMFSFLSSRSKGLQIFRKSSFKEASESLLRWRLARPRSGGQPARKTHGIPPPPPSTRPWSALWPLPDWQLLSFFRSFRRSFRSLRFTLRSAFRTVLLLCFKAGPRSQVVVDSEVDTGHSVHVCFIAGYAQLYRAGGTSVLAPTPPDFVSGTFHCLGESPYGILPFVSSLLKCSPSGAQLPQ